MKIEYLSYFLEVGRSRSLSEASRRLYISQQGLNKAMSAMESELGVRLVERSFGGISLTEEGRIFRNHAEEIVERFEAAKHAIGASSRCDPILSRAAIQLLATPYALAALPRWKNDPIDTIREGTFADIVDQLKTPGMGKLAMIDVFTDSDVFAEYSRLGLAKEDFEAVPLCETKLGIIVRRESPLAKKPEITLEELAQRPLAIVSDPTILNVLDRLYGSQHLPNIVMETTNSSMFVDHVERGRSPGLLDSFAFLNMRSRSGVGESLSFVPLKAELVNVVCLVFRRDSSEANAYRSYAEQVKSAFSGITGA